MRKKVDYKKNSPVWLIGPEPRGNGPISPGELRWLKRNLILAQTLNGHSHRSQPNNHHLRNAQLKKVKYGIKTQTPPYSLHTVLDTSMNSTLWMTPQPKPKQTKKRKEGRIQGNTRTYQEVIRKEFRTKWKLMTNIIKPRKRGGTLRGPRIDK